MKRNQDPLRKEEGRRESGLHPAFELSQSKWKMAFQWGDQARYVTIGARDLKGLQQEIGKAKRFRVPEGVGILSWHEAGRDGFWLHRWLRSWGIENLDVDSSSIEVSRRKRQAKSDRLDVRKLLGMLVRHSGGERGFWSVVKVPGVEEEEARHLHRELEVLWKERTMNRNRIQSFLILQGVVVRNPSGKKFLVELERMRTRQGREIPGKNIARLK